MIAASAFAEKDALAMVALMSLKSGNRRAAQDMRAYPYYLSKSQWDMAKCNVEAAISVSIDVIVHRLGGVNVDDWTLKRISSLSLALFNSGDSFVGMDVKIATLKEVRTAYRRTVRLVRERGRTRASKGAR